MIRVIDAGTVSHLRSQTIYHGLAHARTEETPDTIVLATPGDPYVCIGFHQDLGEVDLEFCAQQDLPVLRRETGGGTVYLDRDQLFVQWVMGPSRLPLRMDRRFELFTQPLVETYRELGVEASFRPVNDVHVAGRKISGTAAARIGSAEVLVGNFIFNFDTECMARILNVPSEAFRDHVAHGLREYMTSMRRELGDVPGHEEVACRYLKNCEKVLGRDFYNGDLTEAEIQAIEEVEGRLSSEEFLRGPEELKRPDPTHRAVKIHEDVRVLESARRVAGGVRRVTATLREGRIEAITLSDPEPGDHGLREMEEALRGVELREESVVSALRARDPVAWMGAILDLQKHSKDMTHERRS